MHTRLAEVTLPEAELLADLYSIVFDLTAVEELCARAVEVSKSNPRDWLVEEALVSSAVIKYGRCFTDGVRMRLGIADLVQLDADAVSTHEYFIELRHKFVAHSVNAFEETYVTAAARDMDGAMLPIESISPGQHRVVLSSSMAEELHKLVARLKSLVQLGVESERKTLLEFIQSLPLETIHSGDPHTPRHVLDVARVRRRRSNKRVQATRSKQRAPDA